MVSLLTTAITPICENHVADGGGGVQLHNEPFVRATNTMRTAL